mgnify:FL=1|jgi:hypothetical protein|tara:strand:+ start:47 stop:379 length:333 start_codon:yes stop_codon:yes gene_type:complete
METGSLTYEEIDQLEKNLSIPYVKQLYTYDEMLVRLLCQVLRQNRYLADQIAKSCTESRMAFNNTNDTQAMLEKLKGDVDFMLGMVTGIKRNKQSRKIKGIQIGTRRNTE